MPRGVHRSPRGLATADPKTRQRVSQLGGLVCAYKLGELFCESRAEKGGLAFVQKYGKEGMKTVRTGQKLLK